jgi:SAM-dependent methyltransferase
MAQTLKIDGVRQGDLMAELRAAPADSVDAIVLFDLYHYFDPATQLRLADEVRRVLKPGGRFILHLPNGEALFSGRVRYWDIMATGSFTRRSIEQLLLEVGTSDAGVLAAVRQAAPQRFVLLRSLWGEEDQLEPLLQAGLSDAGDGLLLPLPQNLLVEDDLASPAFWLAVDHQPHPGGNDFLYPIEVEPAEDELARECVAAVLGEGEFKAAGASPEALASSALHKPANTHWSVRFALWKAVEAGAVFPAFWEVGDKLAHGLKTGPGKLAQPLGTDPRQVFEWRVPAHEQGFGLRGPTWRRAR